MINKRTVIFLIGLSLFQAHPLRAEKSFITADAADLAQLNKMHKDADSLMEADDFKGAVRIYSEIILKEPDDEIAYANLGKCYMVLGDTARAEDAFMNALHIDPGNEFAKMGLMTIRDPDGMHSLESEVDTANNAAGASPDREVLAESVAPIHLPLPPEQESEKTSPTYSKNQKIQLALKKAGYYNSLIDGKIGPKSKHALLQFQKARELPPTGNVDQKTWDELRKYLNE